MPVGQQYAMQARKCFDGHSGRAQTQVRTHGRVQHPASHDDDDARRHLDVDELTGGPALAVLAPYAPSVQRMPRVEDLDFLPDMGRMTARWQGARVIALVRVVRQALSDGSATELFASAHELMRQAYRRAKVAAQVIVALLAAPCAPQRSPGKRDC